MSRFQVAPSQLDVCTDHYLLRLIAQRDGRAYETFYDRHAQTVYSLLYHMLCDDTVAETLLQEVFWQVWIDTARFQQAENGVARLLCMARSQALVTLREQKRQPRNEKKRATAAPLVSMRESDFQTSDESQASWSQIQVRTTLPHTILKNLSRAQQHCLTLAYFHGFRREKIAQMLGLPLSTVNKHLRESLELVQQKYTWADG